MPEPLLRVERLTAGFDSKGSFVPAVIDVSLHLDKGETLCLVGESGSGKSLTAFSIMGLVEPPGRIDRGTVVFKGRDLLRLAEREMQGIRGREIALVFQEPMTALNPVFSIGSQIAETLRVHGLATRQTARAKAIELLEAVQVPDPAKRVRDYPHQLSGGLRQRALIALALACNPDVLIADEPTTALDVTIQAQILELMRRLQAETGMSILFITHNLGVVAHHADDVVVMYSGRVVESAPVRPLFAQPEHPYTQGLLACLPGKARQPGQPKPKRLFAIRGQVSSPLAPPPGCAFEPRCDLALAECSAGMPPLLDIRQGRQVRCVRVQPAATLARVA